MEEFNREKCFDSTLKEEKFNKFYDEFFQVKILKYLKNVKKNHYQCSGNCITENNIDEICMKKCQENHTKFFNQVERVLKDKISHYYVCVDECKIKKNSEFCIDQCTKDTIEKLQKIDINKEFKSFL